MAAEIELMTMLGETDARERLVQLIHMFEQRTSTPVHVTALDLSSGGADVFQTALYSNGPAISEISPAWLSSLVAMNALRPVPARVQHSIGSEAAFLTGAWRSCFVENSSEMWAVPWISGTQLLFYRRDWLAQAGINAATAFTSLAALEQTLQALKDHGFQRPWVTNTRRSASTLHHLASWVWGYGGDFVAEDGLQLLLTSPETQRGMAAYYGLSRFMGPDAAEIDDGRAADLFWNGQAGVILDGQWVYAGRAHASNPELVDQIGFARMPGIPFVGGSHLVVWRHASFPDLAWQLVRFLSNPESTELYAGPDKMLPARRDLFKQLGVETDAFLQCCAESIDAGRVFSPKRYGMLIENRLVLPLAAIWREVLSDPQADPAEIIQRQLAPLEARLQQTLSA